MPLPGGFRIEALFTVRIPAPEAGGAGGSHDPAPASGEELEALKRFHLWVIVERPGDSGDRFSLAVPSIDFTAGGVGPRRQFPDPQTGTVRGETHRLDRNEVELSVRNAYAPLQAISGSSFVSLRDIPGSVANVYVPEGFAVSFIELCTEQNRCHRATRFQRATPSEWPGPATKAMEEHFSWRGDLSDSGAGFWWWPRRPR